MANSEATGKLSFIFRSPQLYQFGVRAYIGRLAACRMIATCCPTATLIVFTGSDGKSQIEVPELVKPPALVADPGAYIKAHIEFITGNDYDGTRSALDNLFLEVGKARCYCGATMLKAEPNPYGRLWGFEVDHAFKCKYLAAYSAASAAVPINPFSE